MDAQHGGGGGGGGGATAARVPTFPEGRGFALLFADSADGPRGFRGFGWAQHKEGCIAARARLAEALAFRGFAVELADSTDMLARARASLSRAAADPATTRVAVGYVGHGYI